MSEALDQSGQPVPESELDPDVFQANTVHRSVTTNEEFKDILIERKPAQYVPDFKRYTEFYSTSSIEDLFKAVAIYCQYKAVE